MKKFILCADDFGETPEVCEGILQLVSAQRLSAVSCMSNMPSWQQYAANLIKHHDQIAIGLHFNLPSKVLSLIVQSHLGLINKKKIKKALVSQIELFRQQTGFLPDFIDGHQHIHQLPIIRNILVDVYWQYYPEKKAFIRNTNNSSTGFKARIIRCSGAKKLNLLLKKYRIPHNKTFSGIYNFADSSNYHQHFLTFLKETANTGLIMCHPGLGARQNELTYLLDESFLYDLKAHQAQLDNPI